MRNVYEVQVRSQKLRGMQPSTLVMHVAASDSFIAGRKALRAEKNRKRLRPSVVLVSKLGELIE